MPSFGDRSMKAATSCSHKCQLVLHEAIKHFDFSVICGHRGRKKQTEAFNAGKSQLEFPDSNHNSNPSHAFDVVPYPEGFAAPYDRFFEMASYILAAAAKKGVKLRWGGHWKNFSGNGEMDRDWAHFEEIE